MATEKQCCEAGCEEKRFCLGRCARCFRMMDPEVAARLRSLPRAEREAEFEEQRVHPPLPKWTYENPEGEAELARIAERQGELQCQKTSH